MGEIKIFGYIIVAVLFLSIIIMPLVEAFLVYRERLMLSDALYSSCRVAAEASNKYRDMININAEVYKKSFCEAFGETFATSFGLNYVGMSGDILTFEPLPTNDAYDNFTVELDFDSSYVPIHYDISRGTKTFTMVTVDAESQYKFKTRFMGYFHRLAPGIVYYELCSKQEYLMVVTN